MCLHPFLPNYCHICQHHKRVDMVTWELPAWCWSGGRTPPPLVQFLCVRNLSKAKTFLTFSVLFELFCMFFLYSWILGNCYGLASQLLQVSIHWGWQVLVIRPHSSPDKRGRVLPPLAHPSSSDSPPGTLMWQYEIRFLKSVQTAGAGNLEGKRERAGERKRGDSRRGRVA